MNCDFCNKPCEEFEATICLQVRMGKVEDFLIAHTKCTFDFYGPKRKLTRDNVQDILNDYRMTSEIAKAFKVYPPELALETPPEPILAPTEMQSVSSEIKLPNPPQLEALPSKTLKDYRRCKACQPKLPCQKKKRPKTKPLNGSSLVNFHLDNASINILHKHSYDNGFTTSHLIRKLIENYITNILK